MVRIRVRARTKVRIHRLCMTNQGRIRDRVRVRVRDGRVRIRVRGYRGLHESRRLRCANGMSARPLKKTVPRTLSLRVRPETASSRVVLPLPLGPITASTCAAWRQDVG